MRALLIAGINQSPGMGSQASPPEQPNEAYFAICLSVKDQNEDLREWLTHHRKVGAGKFYIMDDNSIVPIAETLNDFIEDGAIHLYVMSS